ncbi:hypothetical protein FQN50_006111 [Emmonsiellopsis sp. PD_5]|nr:hypothetical protein FQN50_006111 [Emmonsiellopsis sp. PD_5]
MLTDVWMITSNELGGAWLVVDSPSRSQRGSLPRAWLPRCLARLDVWHPEEEEVVIPGVDKLRGGEMERRVIGQLEPHPPLSSHTPYIDIDIDIEHNIRRGVSLALWCCGSVDDAISGPPTPRSPVSSNINITKSPAAPRPSKQTRRFSSTAMTDQFAFSYPSPLQGYENLPPLPEDKDADGKSFKNPQHGILSKAYEEFPDPLDKGRRGGFDIHIYHYQPLNRAQQNNPDQVAFAKALWERIRREFPELRIYTFFDRPVGPHPVAMFEVNLFTPAQFGAFVPWLVINRGPLSVLIHPNTGDDQEEERNHTQRATWMGDRIPLDLRVFKLMREKQGS